MTAYRLLLLLFFILRLSACSAESNQSDVETDSTSDAATDPASDAETDSPGDVDTSSTSDGETDSSFSSASIAPVHGDRIIELLETGSDPIVTFGSYFRDKSIYWTAAEKSGACVFYQASLGMCEPECTLPQMCGADNQCHGGFEFQSAGNVTVSGLKSALSLELRNGGGASDYYVANWNPSLTDNQLFDAEDTITASAAGGEHLGDFNVSVRGSADLEIDLSCPLALTAGTPLTIHWNAGTSDDRIQFVMKSGNHGSQFSAIVCDTTDIGDLTIDASIISAYLSEFRPIEMWDFLRYRQNSVRVGDVRVFLRAGSLRNCYW